jgi:hypothetical protein
MRGAERRISARCVNIGKKSVKFGLVALQQGFLCDCGIEPW